MKSDYRSTLRTGLSVAGHRALRRRWAIGDIRSARLRHLPPIHFDHRKSGSCWRDPQAADYTVVPIVVARAFYAGSGTFH